MNLTGVRSQQGTAVVAALLATILLGALGSALVLNTSAETMIASNFRNAAEARYAADAIAERVLVELLAARNWNDWLDGSARSAFVDGQPGGTRVLPDGTTIDLSRITNTLNCGKSSTCTIADMNAFLVGRPWGPNNPRWRLSAHGNLRDIHPTGTVESPFYVVAMVGDDSSENDGDPQHGTVTTAGNPGSGVVQLRAEAFGPRSAHKVLEATIVRPGAVMYAWGPAVGSWQGVRVLSWREVG